MSLTEGPQRSDADEVTTCNTLRKVELIVIGLSRNIHWWCVLDFSMKIMKITLLTFQVWVQIEITRCLMLEVSSYIKAENVLSVV